MRHIRTLILLICLFVSLISLATLGSAQELRPVRIYTTGLFDPADGSVLYSVLLTTNPNKTLIDLTITSPLPEGATFVDVFWTPTAASFVGEEDGIVTWTLPELTADTIIGPFSYRVTFEDLTPPQAVLANINWSDGASSFTPAVGELVNYEHVSSLTVDAAGTKGLVPVGNSGVWVNIPPEALAESVTFTFERLPFPEDESLLPQVSEDIWWCSLFKLTVEPNNTRILLPISFVYPTRRTLTPGLPVSNFIQLDDGTWQLLDQGSQTRKADALLKPAEDGGITSFIAMNGNFVIDDLQPGFPLQTATKIAGVSTQLRAGSITSASGTLDMLAGLGLDVDSTNSLVNDDSWQ